MPKPRIWMFSLIALGVCCQPVVAVAKDAAEKTDARAQQQSEQDSGSDTPERENAVSQEFDAELRPLATAVASGEYAQAMETVEAMREEWEGRPQFDFLAGIAAAETGDYSEAAYAFERILILQPNHHRARLELARTHFMAENWGNAQGNFRKVLESDPPEAVAEKVDTYLQAIEKAQSRQRGRFELSAKAGLGYDSNVNSATDDATIDIGNLIFQLADNNRETSDLFLRWGIDSAYKHPLSRTRRLSANVSIEDKRLLDEDEYTLTDARIGGSYQHESGNHSWHAGVDYNHYWQDSEQLVKLIDIRGQWQYQRSEPLSYTAFSSLGTLRFPGNRARERNQFVLGGGGSWSQSGFRQSLTLYGAHEPARSSALDQFGRNRLGLSSQSSWLLNDSQRIEGQLSFLQSDFRDPQPVFGKEREDSLLRASVTWRWALTRQLTLTSQLSYRNNDSNIDLFSYEQTIAEAGVRYQFF